MKFNKLIVISFLTSATLLNANIIIRNFTDDNIYLKLTKYSETEWKDLNRSRLIYASRQYINNDDFFYKHSYDKEYNPKYDPDNLVLTIGSTISDIIKTEELNITQSGKGMSINNKNLIILKPIKNSEESSDSYIKFGKTHNLFCHNSTCFNTNIYFKPQYAIYYIDIYTH